MKRIKAPALLLSLALISISVSISGCKTVPQPQGVQRDGSSNRSANSASSAHGDEYNRTYESESRHRHHHGRRDASGDNGSGYDRAETANEPSGDTNDTNARPYQQRSSNSLSRHHNSRALTAAPGQFDFYLLNLSWSPEFCHGHPAAAECAQHRAFTLHGLWPQNNDGTYPEDCSEAPGPGSPTQYSDIYPDARLLEHEWQTHGTCSGLAADQFLGLARRAEQSIHVPDELAHLTQPTSLTPGEIMTLFTRSNPAIPASSLAITCGNNYLTALEVCVDKNLKPESCQAVKTCGANQIRIPAPK